MIPVSAAVWRVVEYRWTRVLAARDEYERDTHGKRPGLALREDEQLIFAVLDWLEAKNALRALDGVE